MGHLVWSDALSVGVYELDDQHMRLVGMINGMIDLTSRKKTDEAAIRAAYLTVLDDMVMYATVHFETGERWLKSIGFPRFDSHAEEHQGFSRRVAELRPRTPPGHPAPRRRWCASST